MKLQNLSNLAIDKFTENEMNVVNSITKWSQEKK